jgi:hypothetical protein
MPFARAQGVNFSSFFERRELEAALAALPPRAAPSADNNDDDDAAVRQLASALAAALADAGCSNCCMFASVLLYELLSSRGVAATLVQGFQLLGAPPSHASWHVWLATARGGVHDVGRATALLGLRRAGTPEDVIAPLAHATYAAAADPALTRGDLETEAQRAAAAAAAGGGLGGDILGARAGGGDGAARDAAGAFRAAAVAAACELNDASEKRAAARFWSRMCLAICTPGAGWISQHDAHGDTWMLAALQRWRRCAGRHR